MCSLCVEQLPEQGCHINFPANRILISLHSGSEDNKDEDNKENQGGKRKPLLELVSEEESDFELSFTDGDMSRKKLKF